MTRRRKETMGEKMICERCTMTNGWHTKACAAVPYAPQMRAVARAPFDWLGWTLEALLLVVFLAVLAHLMSGCAPRSELPAPCDTLTLGELKAECHRRVRAECARSASDVVDEDCAVLKACDKRIRAWVACSDADAGAP